MNAPFPLLIVITIGLTVCSMVRADPHHLAEIIGESLNGSADQEEMSTSSSDQQRTDEQQTARLREIPDLKVQFDSRGVPTDLEGDLGYYRGNAPEAELKRLLQDLGPIYRAKGTERLQQSSAHVNAAHIGVYRTGQYIGEIPVAGAGLIIITDAITGKITRIKGDFLPDTGLTREPKIPAADAVALAAEAISFQDNVQLDVYKELRPPELVYHISGHLGWRLAIEYELENTRKSEIVIVDAVAGTLVHRRATEISALSAILSTIRALKPLAMTWLC